MTEHDNSDAASAGRGPAGGYDRPGDAHGGFDRAQAERDARDAIGAARDELQGLLENQKNAVSGHVHAIADALRNTAADLRARDQNTVAAYVEHVAERIAYWSDGLAQRHIVTLARDIRQLAHERPGLVIAGALVLGFAATRFLKSSGNASTDRASTVGYDRFNP